MNNFPVAVPQYQMQPPQRVQAAQQFVCWYSQRGTSTCMPMGSDGWNTQQPPEPTPKEKATYEAALETLRLYFSGEMDFGDCAPTAIAEKPPDDPQNPIPVMP